MDMFDILIVDDDINLTSLYGAFLSVTPFTYKLVSSGEGALKAIENTEFRVFIIDINLGPNVMSGVDLGVIIRKKFKNSKIFALTGHSTLFDNFDPAIAGFDEVFNKPMGFKFLVEKLKKILVN